MKLILLPDPVYTSKYYLNVYHISFIILNSNIDDESFINIYFNNGRKKKFTFESIEDRDNYFDKYLKDVVEKYLDNENFKEEKCEIDK